MSTMIKATDKDAKPCPALEAELERPEMPIGPCKVRRKQRRKIRRAKKSRRIV